MMRNYRPHTISVNFFWLIHNRKYKIIFSILCKQNNYFCSPQDFTYWWKLFKKRSRTVLKETGRRDAHVKERYFFPVRGLLTRTEFLPGSIIYKWIIYKKWSDRNVSTDYSACIVRCSRKSIIDICCECVIFYRNFFLLQLDIFFVFKFIKSNKFKKGIPFFIISMHVHTLNPLPFWI